MEIIRRRYRRAEGDEAWIAPLATALQHFQLIYLVGALFVGIAYQPFVYLVLGTQIGFDSWLARRGTRKERKPQVRAADRPFGTKRGMALAAQAGALRYVDDSRRASRAGGTAAIGNISTPGASGSPTATRSTG